MTQRDDRDGAENRPPGRLRAAWRVLRGEAVVHDQIRAEWAEYQAMFSDLLQRWSAMQARQAKLEKARLKRVQEDVQAAQGDAPFRPVPGGDKAALRSLAAQRLGLGPYRRNGKPPAPPQTELPIPETDA